MNLSGSFIKHYMRHPRLCWHFICLWIQYCLNLQPKCLNVIFLVVLTSNSHFNHILLFITIFLEWQLQQILNCVSSSGRVGKQTSLPREVVMMPSVIAPLSWTVTLWRILLGGLELNCWSMWNMRQAFCYQYFIHMQMQ